MNEYYEQPIQPAILAEEFQDILSDPERGEVIPCFLKPGFKWKNIELNRPSIIDTWITKAG